MKYRNYKVKTIQEHLVSLGKTRHFISLKDYINININININQNILSLIECRFKLDK